jgi:hypothetical protein
MYVYLLWDHGRNSNFAWNAILLPDNMRLDVGCRDQTLTSRPATPAVNATTPAPQPAPTPKSGGKRRRGDDGDDDMIGISRAILDEVRATSRGPTSASSATTASTPSTGVVPEEVAVTARAKELSAQADLLKDQLRTLPDECSGDRNMLTTNLSLVLRKLCSVTGGLQTSPQA